MDEIDIKLIEALAAERFVSGSELGMLVGVSRAAVWKRLKGLTDQGLKIDAVKGRGYRLEKAFLPVNRQQILSCIASDVQAMLGRLEIHSAISSTNDYLLKNPMESGSVCIADMQFSGRGRRGRAWVSPFGASIYMSIAWKYASVSAVQGLSLAVGLVVVELLSELGVRGLSLKWPNDVLLEGKKLGGILIELSADAVGDCYVVVGLGLNVNLAESLSFSGVEIDQPWSDLSRANLACSKSELAGMIIAKLLTLLSSFERKTFSHYRGRWEAFNAHQGMFVVLSSGVKEVEGIVLGVGGDGALLLEVDGQNLSFSGGELSLREKYAS